MGNSVYIVSVDAKDLFLANYSSPNSKEYSVKLAGSDHNDQFNTRRFVNTLDYRKGVRKMSQAHLGCFSGTVTPNVNMLDIFKQNERADNPNSILNFGQMSLRKLSMICPEGTKVKINGKEIPLITGIFELGMDQINITSLEFSEAVNVNIYYMF